MENGHFGQPDGGSRTLGPALQEGLAPDHLQCLEGGWGDVVSLGVINKYTSISLAV
jgi:hypothetical protein